MNSLSERLSALRIGCPDAGNPGRELAQRLQRLRVRSRQGEAATPADSQPLSGQLRAEQIAEGVLLIARRMAFAGGCAGPLNLPGVADYDGSNLLFIDTETTGLSGGSGTLAFMVGMARLDAEGLQTRQYLLTRFGGEHALLAALASEIRPGDLLVSYNGKSFDLPLLAGRCRMSKLGNPFDRLPHLDLLHWIRRAFATRWPDCRLAQVERQLLGFERENDLPGAEAPAAWFDWIRHGRGERLPGVARHNRWDLRSLAQLVPSLQAIYLDPSAHGADTLALARYYRLQGEPDRALALLERDQTQLTLAGVLELARQLRRVGRIEEARVIWSGLAAQGNNAAREHLAKYYEHVAGDCGSALRVAERLPGDEMSRRRCRRLQRKLALNRAQLPLIAQQPDGNQ